MEFVVERGSQKRILGARRVVARDEYGEPKFLVTLFEDVTEQRGLSQEVEETKKFLELVLDHIPTSVVVKRVDDRKYLLVNRHAEKFMDRSRQQMIGHRIEEFPSRGPRHLHQSSRQRGDPHEGRGRHRGISGAVGGGPAPVHGAPCRRSRREAASRNT